MCSRPDRVVLLDVCVTWSSIEERVTENDSNVPLGAAIFTAVLLFVDISPETNKKNLSLAIAEKLKHLDGLGTILFLGSIVSLLLVLQWGGQTISWRSGISIGLFITFGVCGILFIALQWRLGEYATIPFRVVRIRSIYMGALVLFTLGIASISVGTPFPTQKRVQKLTLTKLAFYLPLYFQAIQGVSATHSGVDMVAYVAPSIVAIGITGGLVSRFGHYVSSYAM